MKRALRLILTIAGVIISFLCRGMERALALILATAAVIAGFLTRMKKVLALILIIAACIAGFLSIRGVMPFMAVFGTSMEPELHAGNLMLIEEVLPSEVKVGDIIVFTIPRMVREQYNYPLVIAHRVMKVNTEPSLTFRTKGDNTGEDPFTVRPQDLRGTVSDQIPYLGLPLLFFQSQQGLIFIIVGLCLLALYLYGEELGQGRRKAQRGIFAPIIEENRRTSRVMAQRMETTEQVLGKFTSAIEVYAQHLQSHTSAIQGLSEASQELKKGAAEQNKVLTRLTEVMEQARPKVEEVVPKVEEVVPKVEEIKFPPGCIRSRPRHIDEKEIFRAG